MRLFNTLIRAREEFTPLEPGVVRMYTCGPTVYRFIHIGNLRAFLTADLLRRALLSQGYEVRHIKNITDVGHMRQEMVEKGEDKVIAEALAQGKTPQEIAQFYTKAFLEDEAKVNILPAQVFPRATDHIPEMIQIIARLLERGRAYQSGGNIYFNVASFPRYGMLSLNQQEGLLAGVRADVDPLKRSPADFTLWKVAEPGRTMKWDSPWGEGFPGWHIECSAMSTKYLGEQLDIHTGGVDNIFPHHDGEIAQSEGAFGKPFVQCWVHCQHVLAHGQKMAKSAGNAYTLAEIEERGFEPLAFRYLCLTAHYRQRMNFTFTALLAAQKALDKLRRHALVWAGYGQEAAEHSHTLDPWLERFRQAMADDLNTPRALTATWALTRCDLLPVQKLNLVLEFDRVLGLGLEDWLQAHSKIPREVLRLAEQRQAFRIEKLFPDADKLRARALSQGFQIEDHRGNSVPLPVQTGEGSALRRLAKAIPSSKVVASLLDEPDALGLSVTVLANGYPEDLHRLMDGILAHLGARPAEVLVVDNGTFDGTWELVDDLAAQDSRVRAFHTDHYLGEAAGKNIALKQARGRYVVILDASVGLEGDVFTPLVQALEQPGVGIAGAWGLLTEDFRDFREVDVGEVDALQGYCFAFRREDLRRAGLMDERYIFYRNLDIDFSFQLRSKGFRALALPDLPLRRYRHRAWEALAPGEREKKSRRNWRRFFKKYHHRQDLLVMRRSVSF